MRRFCLSDGTRAGGGERPRRVCRTVMYRQGFYGWWQPQGLLTSHDADTHGWQRSALHRRHVEKTIYESALVLAVAGLAVERQGTVSAGYRVIGMNAMDLLVEGRLLIELEAAESIYDARCVQCARLLRTAGLPPAGRSGPVHRACRRGVPYSRQGDGPNPMSDHQCHARPEIGPPCIRLGPRVFFPA